MHSIEKLKSIHFALICQLVSWKKSPAFRISLFYLAILESSTNAYKRTIPLIQVGERNEVDVLTTTTGLTDALDTVTSENECAEGGHAKRSALSDRIELNGGPKKTKKKGTPARKKERKRNAKRSSVSSVCFRWCGRFPSAPTANQAHCRIIIVCVLARFVRMAADRLQPSRCLHLHHPESTLAASAIKGDREIGGRGASIATSFAALGSYVASQWTPHYGSTREDSDYLYRRGKIVTESERGLSDEMLSGVGRDFDNFDHTTNGDPQSAPDLIATFASRRLFYFRFPHCVMSDFSRTAQLSPAGSLFRTLTERSCCLLFFKFGFLLPTFSWILQGNAALTSLWMPFLSVRVFLYIYIHFNWQSKFQY